MTALLSSVSVVDDVYVYCMYLIADATVELKTGLLDASIILYFSFVFLEQTGLRKFELSANTAQSISN